MLAGTLKAVSTSFTPASGDTFEVLDSDGNITGTFGTFTQVGGGGRTYAVTYLQAPPADRVRLAVVPQFLLTVSKAGAGSGLVTSTPSGVNCGAACAQSYDSGTPVTLSASAAAGSTFTGWSGAGCSGTGTCSVTMSEARSVTATFTLIPGTGPGPGPGPGPDTTRPAASGLAVTASTFRAASRGASIAAVRRPIGTTVRYRLTEAAKVRFTVQREKAGRKVGKTCKAPTRANRTKRACKRFVAVAGSFTHSGKNGANSFKFTGRLGGRKLAPGTYRLTGVPTDAAGNRGVARTVRFKIVR
jgi:hypothetical protein